MKIPPFMLTQEVTIEAHQGETAYGQSFAEPRTVKCRVESRKRVAVGAQGSDVTVAATLYLDPSEDVPVESKVTLDGRSMTVIDSRTHYDLTQGQYLEVMCA
jgi:hypothetical protein